jgi:hypothetical protein
MRAANRLHDERRPKTREDPVTDDNAKQPPWKRPRPKGKRRVKLTQASKAIARERAAKAGRPYPNFIDNAAAARLQRARKKR